MSELIRIKLNDASQVERFRAFETLCVLNGWDLAEELATWAKAVIVEQKGGNWVPAGIVSSEELQAAAKARFGIDLVSVQLFALRGKWKEGEHYWSAPNGRRRVFRYDLKKCLPAIEELAKGKE